jgi:hypothetical protein
MLIVATEKSNGSEVFYTELIRINNEQTNLIRQQVKNSNQNGKQKDDSFLFEELSNLNNELINVQRELAKKIKNSTI